MTVSTRTSAPSYKIFDPDALDVAYANGVISNPVMGGIASAAGITHSMSKMRNQDNYLASQEKFNEMAATLDAMEMDSKTKQKMMDVAGTLISKGEGPANVLGGSDIYNGNPAGALLPGLLRDKIAAETAAAGRSGNDGGVKEKHTVQTVDPVTGKTIVHTVPGPPPPPKTELPPKPPTETAPGVATK